MVTAYLQNQANPNQRKTRAPAFPIAGVMKPFGLYPFFIHPVLPGETMQHLSMKARHISMPLRYPLGGAWLETWFAYVKLTDIDKDLGQMFVQDGMSSTAYERTGGNDARHFVGNADVDWVALCTNKVHSSYFMHETETPEVQRQIDGVPQVKMSNRSWYENLMVKAGDVTVPTNDASDLYKHLQDYETLQQMGMVEMTYEKYLEQYGANITRETEGDPEILRFARSWTLPTNKVEPSTGSPTTAWTWSDDISADKPKRFNEPGFIIGLQAIRPKMFQDNVTRSLVGKLWGFSDWFPIYTLDDPTAGIKSIGTDSNIFKAASRTDPGELELIYDHRDLLMNGETFVNCSNAEHPYTLPFSTGLKLEDASTPEDLRGEYAESSDVDLLFSSVNSDETVCYYDGIVNLRITGHVKQGTPL